MVIQNEPDSALSVWIEHDTREEAQRRRPYLVHSQVICLISDVQTRGDLLLRLTGFNHEKVFELLPEAIADGRAGEVEQVLRQINCLVTAGGCT